jgi:hypothetical protein
MSDKKNDKAKISVNYTTGSKRKASDTEHVFSDSHMDGWSRVVIDAINEVARIGTDAQKRKFVQNVKRAMEEKFPSSKDKTNNDIEIIVVDEHPSFSSDLKPPPPPPAGGAGGVFVGC